MGFDTDWYNAMVRDRVGELFGQSGDSDPRDGGCVGSGDPADRPDLHGDLPGLPAALGRGVARIHGLDVPADVPDFPVDQAIAQRLESGLVIPADLPEPYDRYEAARLVEILDEAGFPSSYQPPVVPLVGSLTMDRILMADGEVSGISGDFGLVGDVHLDLAVIQHSVHKTLGAEAVFGFYEAYGTDPNIVALDHYVLAGLLLGWIR